MPRRIFCGLLWALMVPHAAGAAEVRVAVAGNFAEVMGELAAAFEARTGHRAVLSAASTGKHYAQIVQGAPFDVFFAADARHPERLERDGRAVAGTRFTYAIGAIVLWSPRPGLVDAQGQVLKTGGFRFLAIANPALAPYGRAAEEMLRKWGLWEGLQDRLVRGQTITQAYQFVKTGNAELGFVALSQVKRPGKAAEGSWWRVPQALHSPIEQQVVLLRDTPPARALLEFVRGDAALKIIRAYGYTLGDAQ